MILIPQGRKILIIAASLFVATFSLLFFVMSGGDSVNNSHLKTSVFENFFHQESPESTHESASSSETLPLVTLDASGIILDTNIRFEETIGYSSKDLKDKAFFHLVDADDLIKFAQDYADAVSSGKIMINNGPYHLIAADETKHLVLVTFASKDGKAHGDRGITLTITDITESLHDQQGRGNTQEKSPKGTVIKDLGEKKTDEKSGSKIIVDKTG